MRSPRRVVSPSSSRVETSKQQTITTTVRNTNLTPAVYEQKFEQVRQQSNGPSVSPTVSFGLGSTVKNVKTMNLANDDLYEGELNANGDFTGYGKYTYKRDNMEYVGQFQNGMQNGRGKLFKYVYASRNANHNSSDAYQKVLVYDGQWKNGMKNGEGKYYYDPIHPETHYYEGPWENDQRHGISGTYVGPIGVYVGRWKKGKMHGKGKLIVQKTKTVYQGQFSGNQYVRGVITYENGDQYNGEVKNGLRDDHQGRYVYNNFQGRSSTIGSPEKIVKYVGGWHADSKKDESGEATITYPDGQTLKGTFKQGKFVDSIRCTYQWPDRHNFNGWIQQNHGQYIFKGIMKGPQGQSYEV